MSEGHPLEGANTVTHFDNTVPAGATPVATLGWNCTLDIPYCAPFGSHYGFCETRTMSEGWYLYPADIDYSDAKALGCAS